MRPLRISSLPVLLLLANSGSPLETSTVDSNLTAVKHVKNVSKNWEKSDDEVDKLLQKLPPYKPPHTKILQAAAKIQDADLLTSLVDPISYDPREDFYNKPEGDGPYFDLHRTRNVTALQGVTTNLVCRVRRLGNHTVSWIRLRDTSLLTVGRYTYTTDLRFEAFHSPHTDDWIIRLKSPRPSDSGQYGCQISTTPHMTRIIHVKVHEPKTHIIGGPDMYVDIGSMVNLSCVVSYTERPPIRVTWLHNGIEISFRGPRDGVSLITEKAEQTTIHLLMQNASPYDSGIYECIPDNAPASTIKVHILTAGDKLVAGLQTNAGFRAKIATTTTLILASFTLFLFTNFIQ